MTLSKTVPLFSRYKDDTGKTTLRSLEFDDLDFDRPILVALPGASAFGGKPRAVSGMIKAAERMLDSDLRDDVQITSVKYPGLGRMAFNFLNHKEAPTSYTSPFGRQLFNNLLLPIITDGNHSYADDGTLISPKKEGAAFDEMITKMNNITLYSYSAGTWITQGLRNILNKSLIDLGYTDEDRQHIVSSIHSLSLGNVAKIVNDRSFCDDQKNHYDFTAIYVRGENDIVARLLVGAPHEEEIAYDEAVDLLEDGDTSIHVTKSLSSRAAHYFEHVSGVEKNSDYYPDADIYRMVPSLPAHFMAQHLPLHHGLDLFITDTERNILANMITRPDTGNTIKEILNRETHFVPPDTSMPHFHESNGIPKSINPLRDIIPHFI